MKLTSLYSCALIGGAALALASCQSEEAIYDSMAREVRMTVDITKDVDEQTRATLDEVGGSLKCLWEENDMVMVTDAAGAKLGVLKLTSGAGQSKATFDGTLVTSANGNVKFNFMYLGKKSENELKALGNPVELDYSVQDGKAESLAYNDFFTSSQTVNIAEGRVYTENMGLKRKIAFAHFELKFPAGVNYTNEDVTISGTGVYNRIALGLDNTMEYGAGKIKISGTKDFYMCVLPNGSEAIAPEFRVTIDGKVYKGTKGSRTWKASEFVRSSHGVGVPVVMELTDEDPGATDPGDFDNWGGNEDYPAAPFGPVSKIGLSKDAWCHNYYTDVDKDFGFAAPLEYKYNAIKNGYLTSASYRDGQEAKYFQWGRWLGFPKGVVYAAVEYYGGFVMNEANIKYPRGIDAISTNDQRHLYYCWNMDTRPCYAWITDTNWEKQQAINSSIIFGVNEYDYLKDTGDCMWEDRSGNPCPDGYRIPTMAELEVFAPSVDQFNGTHAEVKDIAGTSYAIKWTVEGNGVKIQSVPTSKSTVKADDPIFNNAKTVVLEANGMLYCDYPNSISDSPSAKFATSFDRGWKTSGYWTSESAAWADGKFGGVALMVRVNGSTAKIGMEIVERTAGLCIIPVKCETAKATPIKPWFPLGY